MGIAGVRERKHKTQSTSPAFESLIQRLRQGPLPPNRLATDLIRDVIEWDVDTWAWCLPFWAPVLALYPPEATLVLTLGERHGGLSLWFALHGFQVVCSDYRCPTNRAEELHREYGVQSRIRYAGASAFSLPFPAESFGIVAAKSVIGGLKLDPKDKTTRTLHTHHLATNEIHRVLRPGGHYLGAENMVGSVVHRAGRRILHGDKIGWRHLTVSEVDVLFDRYAAVEQQQYGCVGTHWRQAALNKWSAGLDRLFCPWLPASTKYVGFIRARK